MTFMRSCHIRDNRGGNHRSIVVETASGRSCRRFYGLVQQNVKPNGYRLKYLTFDGLNPSLQA